jgi:hypothetical protein
MGGEVAAFIESETRIAKLEKGMPIREQAEGRTERSASSKQEAKAFFLVVIPGLDPGIHAFRSKVRQKIRHSRACLPRRSFSEDGPRRSFSEDGSTPSTSSIPSNS